MIDAVWSPYTADERAPWNLRRVVHLHRRAGFAGTWSEMQRDLKEGPVASVDRLLAGQASLVSPPDFASIADLLADSAVAAGEINRLKAWWFYRMMYGTDALGEKLTLLWHDHFATANSKVANPALMRRQNDTLRKFARGKFGHLLRAGIREPALLLYLDAQANRRSHPNENLAREAMELFTLGVGHYSEADVKEAARALTGWSVEEGQFANVAARRDIGNKCILGQRGELDGTALVIILLEQPATSERLALKLCRLFFGESIVPPAAMHALAAGLREHDLDIAWATELVLKSQLFFSNANLGSRVIGPVEFVVGAVRALEMFDPSPSTLALADWSARIGQDLFNPPNVGGWPFGRAWVHTRSMITRANFITALISGPDVGRASPYDAAFLPHKYGFGTNSDALLTFHHRLLFGTDPSADIRRRTSGMDERRTIGTLLSSPQAQLG